MTNINVRIEKYKNKVFNKDGYKLIVWGYSGRIVDDINGELDCGCGAVGKNNAKQLKEMLLTNTAYKTKLNELWLNLREDIGKKFPNEGSCDI